MRLARTLLTFPITAAFALVLAVNPRSKAQDIWTPHVAVNPTGFSVEDPTEPDFASDRFTTSQTHAATSHDVREFLGLVIATDDMAIINDLSAAFDERKPSPLVGMLGIQAGTQETLLHPAPVTVNELAVPSKARKALEKGFYAVRKHNLQDAKDKVASALAIFPGYSDALMLSALLSLHANETDAALDAAKEAVQFDFTNGMAHIIQALIHNSRGEYDDALSVLKPALKFRPDAWEGYFERAWAEMAKREFSAALSDVTRAGELAPPKTPRVHLLKGVALMNLNRQAEGASELQEYLRTSPVGTAADKARRMLNHQLPTP